MANNNSVNNLFKSQKVIGTTATNYLPAEDDVYINISNTVAPRTVTLPAASSDNIGRTFIIKDASGQAGVGNNINIVVAGGGLIDGNSSYSLTNPYESIQVYSDGVNHFTEGRHFSTGSTFAAFSGRRSTLQAIPNNSLTTLLGFTTTDINVGAGFNATTGVFTVPNTGRYFLSGSASFLSTGSSGNYECGFSINGSGTLRNGAIFLANQNFRVTTSSNGVFDLTAADTVAFQLMQVSGLGQNTIADDKLSFFQGFQVAISG